MSTNFDYIHETLSNALSPTSLEVIDESHKHQGHSGYHQNGSHFAITIASPAFADKTLLECHRMIYDALGAKVGKDIHALRITIKR
jgi:BolA protein